jgi:3-methyladenine DNA glycosylase AlkD
MSNPITAKEIMVELSRLGSPSIKRILMNHGAKEPLFGVKVEELKKIQKRIKNNHDLSIELYATGNGDAMYLAGLVADADKISAAELERWAQSSTSPMISEYTVAGVGAESPHGWDLGLKWIKSSNEVIASIGWATLGHWVSIRPNEELNKTQLAELLSGIQTSIHKSPNRVRYTMNTFVISVGAYIPELTSSAKKVAKAVGKVSVEMNGTACKVPDAAAYIEKIESKGRIGKKRKMARC